MHDTRPDRLPRACEAYLAFPSLARLDAVEAEIRGAPRLLQPALRAALANGRVVGRPPGMVRAVAELVAAVGWRRDSLAALMRWRRGAQDCDREYREHLQQEAAAIHDQLDRGADEAQTAELEAALAATLAKMRALEQSNLRAAARHDETARREFERVKILSQQRRDGAPSGVRPRLDTRPRASRHGAHSSSRPRRSAASRCDPDESDEPPSPASRNLSAARRGRSSP